MKLPEIRMLAYLLFCVLITLAPITAHAQNCTGPDGMHGDLLYNNAYDVFQGCTTRGWMAFHKPGVPLDCPHVGDICSSDGTIYAGDFNGHKLYAAANNAPSNRTWGPNPSTSGMGFCNTNPYTGGSCDTGRENTQLLKDHASTFLAAEYCADLVAHGHDDWYLPSRNELFLLYQNLYVGHADGDYNFQHSEWTILYWSSTESGNTLAYTIQFNDDGGWANPVVKSIGNKVRCVRR